jgi:hypothetical protein
MRHAVTKSRPKGILEAFTTLTRLYPKTSAAIAFEVGVLASSLVNAARRRRASNGLLAKIVDVVPIPGAAHPPKRKSRKSSKSVKARTKSKSRKPRKSSAKSAVETTTPTQAEAA